MHRRDARVLARKRKTPLVSDDAVALVAQIRQLGIAITPRNVPQSVNLDQTLTALAGLDATAGLVEQTGADTFIKRAIGASADTDILTRLAADGRYADSTHTHAASDISDSTTAGRSMLTAADAAAQTALLGTVTSGAKGLAPASGGGTSNFLRADGSWAAPGGSAPTVATLASNQATGANTTPVTLTGLSFSYATNSTYRIWFMGRVQPTAATTGCGFQFDLSTAVTAIDVQFFHQLANTGTVSGGHSIADDASVGVSSGMPGTSTYPVTGFGLLVTGANSGTAQLRFRSETTAVTTCMAGFTLVVEKVV